MAGRILKAGFLYQRKKDSNLQSSATLSKLFSSSSSKKSKNASESRRYVVLTENTHDDSATLTLFKKALYDEVSEPTNILRIDSNRSYVEVDIQIESSFYIHIETFPLSKAQVLYRGILLKRSDHFGQWRARSFTITMGGRLFFYSEKKGYQVIRIHSQCRMAVYTKRENAFVLKTTTSKKALVLCAPSKECRDRWWNEILRAGCHVVDSIEEVMQDREYNDDDDDEVDDEKNESHNTTDTGVLFLRSDPPKDIKDWVNLIQEFATPVSLHTPSPGVDDDVDNDETAPDSPERLVSPSKLKSRGYTLYELVDTERKFVDDLHRCLSVFREPMKVWLEESKSDQASSSSRNIFDAFFHHSNNNSTKERRETPPWNENDMNLIFGELDKLLAFNEQLLQALETILPPTVHSGAELSKLTDQEITKVSETVAKIFLKFAPFLLLYQGYASHFEHAQKVVTKLCNHKIAKDFMSELADQCNGENLSSFLIKPVQRLLRYKLLMRDVLKCTDRKHDDYEPLNLAIQKLQVVSSKVDKATGQLDDKSKLESSTSSPRNQRQRRHRRIISRMIDEEGEDWKRLSSKSVKMSRASVAPIVSLPAVHPSSPPPLTSTARTAEDERARLPSVVTNLTSKSDVIPRPSFAPIVGNVVPPRRPPSPPKTRIPTSPDERARLRSVVTNLLLSTDDSLRKGSLVVPPGLGSQRRSRGHSLSDSEISTLPDQRASIGRVSKLSPTSRKQSYIQAPPPGVVARRASPSRVFSRQTPDLARVAVTNDTMRRMSKDLVSRLPSVVLDRGVMSKRVHVASMNENIDRVQRRFSEDVMRRLSKDLSIRPPPSSIVIPDQGVVLEKESSSSRKLSSTKSRVASIVLDRGVGSSRIEGENKNDLLVVDKKSKCSSARKLSSTTMTRDSSVILDRGVVSNRQNRVSKYNASPPLSPQDPPGLVVGYSDDERCVETRRLIDFVEDVLEEETKHRLSIVSVASANEISDSVRLVREEIDPILNLTRSSIVSSPRKGDGSSSSSSSSIQQSWNHITLLQDPDPLYALGEVIERRRRRESVRRGTMETHVAVEEEEEEEKKDEEENIAASEKEEKKQLKCWIDPEYFSYYESEDPLLLLSSENNNNNEIQQLHHESLLKTPVEKREYGGMSQEEYSCMLSQELAICAAHAAADYAKTLYLNTRHNLLSSQHMLDLSLTTESNVKNELSLVPATTKRAKRNIRTTQVVFNSMYPPTHKPMDKNNVHISIPQNTSSSIEHIGWYYRDVHNEIFGPFPAKRMVKWVLKGYFPLCTEVYFSNIHDQEKSWTSLATLIFQNKSGLDTWYYADSNRNSKGPFSSRQMALWTHGKEFSLRTQIYRDCFPGSDSKKWISLLGRAVRVLYRGGECT